MTKRLLLAGDTHGDLAHVLYLMATATMTSSTAIFILGDFGYWEHQPSGVDFLDALSRYARSLRLTVYFLDGNHDKTSLLMEDYGDERDDEGFVIVRDNVLYAPRGHRWTWHGTTFIALGGAYSVDKADRLKVEMKRFLDPGTLWFPEEQMTDEDMAAILKADPSPVDVMLAHDKTITADPPWNRKNMEPCLPNQRRLDRAVSRLRPKYYVHGHLHWRYSGSVLSELGHPYVVEGLDCNLEQSDSGVPERSWLVLDVAKLKFWQ